MSNKSDYTSEEWQLLLDVPPAVGTAVMYAGRSGVGSVAEAFAMTSGILCARNGYEGIELIESLVSARVNDGEKSSIETLSSPYRGLSADEILKDVVKKCEQVGKLLRSKATAKEVSGYTDWAIKLAENVANAASEGGFLGFGGERVCEDEEKAIAAVRKALKG